MELPGRDHLPYVGGQAAVLDEVEEILTGVRHDPEPDRVLATVLFTDIGGSTERAIQAGDSRWRDLLNRHNTLVRRELDHFRGRPVIEVAVGRSFVLGSEGLVFLAILIVGVGFEAVWRLSHGTSVLVRDH